MGEPYQATGRLCRGAKACLSWRLGKTHVTGSGNLHLERNFFEQSLPVLAVLTLRAAFGKGVKRA